MKTKLLNLTVVSVCCLRSIAMAQCVTNLCEPGTNSPALIVAPGGNIGIGLFNPTAKLEVAGGSVQISGGEFWTTDNWLVRLKSPLSSAWRLTDPSDDGKYLGIGMAGSGWYFIKSAGAGGTGAPEYPMVVKGSGNVGIGTETPHERLEVEGPYGQLGVGNPLAGAGAVIVFRDAGTVRQSIGNWNSSKSLQFATGGGDPGGLDLRMTISAAGNVGIGTDNPQAKLDVNGKINCTVLELTSDRKAKTGFAAVDNRDLLEKVAQLPITTWHYTNAPGVRHLGPTAQDFRAAFHLGTDDTHIATVDADGVALAAIQGLYELLQEKDARIASLEQKLAQMDALAGRLAAVEKLTAASSLSSALVEEVGPRIATAANEIR